MPSPVRRVKIPNKRQETAVIPTVRDRIVQRDGTGIDTSVRADILGLQLRLQADRSAEDAVRFAQLCGGYNHVVDLDLSQFFDTVDHDILMGLVDKDRKTGHQKANLRFQGRGSV